MTDSGSTEPIEQKPGTIRRRIILIKRVLQMRYVMLVFLAVVLTVTVITVDLYYVLGKLSAEHQVSSESLKALLTGSLRLLAIHLPIYFILTIVVAVFVSHKFAGPIFRLEKVTEAMAAGDLTARAKLRDGDELFDTAEHINKMLELLRQKLVKEKHLSERIAQRMEEISLKLTGGSMTPAQAAEQIDDLLIEVRHIASEFKL